MSLPFLENLERRLQFSTSIKYGVDASGDPDVTGVLSATGPGLKDLGAQGVRLFTDTSFLSSDFDTLPSGKIYVRNPSLVTSLAYAEKYHNAGIAVTLCIQLSTDRSMIDGSPLVDKDGNPRKLSPTELRSPKVFATWYDTLSRAQISKTDKTSVTKVLDFWEIGNEPTNGSAEYWPIDLTQADGGVESAIDSYIDHDLIPAYGVLSKLHEPVIGAGIASGTVAAFNDLNNQPGARFHQYSNHCDYLNFHPYGYLNSPLQGFTPQAYVLNFTNTIYGDGTVTKPFVISEYNLTDYAHPYPLEPDPNPQGAAQQAESANDLDAAHTALLNTPHVQQRCAWIYYYRLIADGKYQGGLLYPPPAGQSAYTPLTTLYDMFQGWAKGTSSASAAKTSEGVLNLGAKAPSNAIAVQEDGKTLVVTDDGVRRYDTDGKLDSAYGVNGFAALPLIGETAALQSDGNLLVAGMANDGTGLRFHLVVTRLSTSGKVDKGFGTKGNFSLASGTGTQAIDMALRAGKIVIVGGSRALHDGFVVRLDLTGHLDTSFSAAGIALVKNRGAFSDLSIAKSGAITLEVTPYLLTPQTSILRLTGGGALDKTFSQDGVTDPQPIAGDGMFVDPDGTVLLVGHAPLADRQVLVRYAPNGNLDAAFGDQGVQTLTGKKFIRGMPIELPDGSRYLYGSIAPSITSDSKRIFLSRLTADDQFDRGFGFQGVMTLSSPNVQDLPFAAALDADGGVTIAAGAFTQRADRGMSQELFLVPELS